MQNAPSTSETYQQIVNAQARLSLLGFSKESVLALRDLVISSGLGTVLQCALGDLSRYQEQQCDIAIAIFSGGDDANAYLTALTHLTQNPRITATIAVISETGRPEMLLYHDRLFANHVIYLPIISEDFNKTLMTQVVSVKI